MRPDFTERFYRMRAVEPDTLRAVRDQADKHIDDALDAFYGTIRQVPELSAKFQSDDHVNHAKSAQRRHWIDGLFADPLSDAFQQRAARIGQTHQRIGLEPSAYLSAYAFVLEHLIRALVSSRFVSRATLADRLVAAVKAALFDMDIVIDGYLDAERAMRLTAEEAARMQLNQMIETFERDVHGVVSAIASASTELAQTAELVGGNTQATQERANRLSEQSRNLSAGAQQINANSVSANDRLEDSRRAIDAVVAASAQMTEAAKEITSVVDVIAEVAERTGLLALNASIEAARAGEAGKGFAVVASEVKTLANQTAASSQTIARKVAQIQAIVATVNDDVSVASHKNAELVDWMQKIAETVSGQVSAARSMVSDSEELLGFASETGCSVEESTSAARELSIQTEMLRRQSDQFVSSLRRG